MTKSSASRLYKKKSEKLREKAKRMMLKDYPKLMEDPEQRKKIFEMIDNAEVALDAMGNVQIFYDNQENKNLINLK
jgi:signal transduction protein with GAF and PtsI domain